MQRILIAPLGDTVGRDSLEFLREPLERVFSVPVQLADPVPLPPHAYDGARNQYLSNVILDFLNDRFRKSDHAHLLAVTDRDLTVPSLNFVFGQADMSSGMAVISLARLHPELDNTYQSRQQFEERTLTEAVHEIGHTLGLDHCPNPRCVMFFSNTLRDTDLKGHSFCERCRSILAPASAKGAD